MPCGKQQIRHWIRYCPKVTMQIKSNELSQSETITDVVAIAYPIDGGIVSLLLSPTRMPEG